MKKLKILGILLLFSLSALCQNEAPVLDYGGKKNEFSLDLTPLMERMSPTTNFSYAPQNLYYLKYRRLFNNWNIRAQIGGAYIKEPLNHRTGDSILTPLFSKVKELNITLGLEKISTIWNRAQINYGFDLLFNQTIRDNDANFSQQYYYYGYESNNRSMGIGPVLGARFWFWNRMSLGMEASFILSFFEERSRNTLMRYSLSVPEADPEPFEVKEGIETTFYVPMQIWLGFTL